MPRLYDKRAWRKLSRAYLIRNPLCAQCQDEGRIVLATQVDHIVAVKDGGTWFDRSNLQALCDKHHGLKTLFAEQGKSLKGVAADGTPLDILHAALDETFILRRSRES